MRVLIFQHTAEETPGTLLEWLRLRRLDHTVHHWYRSESAPAPAAHDWLVILGGPMNLDQEAEFGWLREEKKFLRAWLGTGKPVLGICLGGQLLAQALGGHVGRNAEREIGFHPVIRSGAFHPALAHWPEQVPVYQYHEDTFSLPPGASCLLVSPACANQAFSVGVGILGLQFHPESTVEWIRGNAASIAKAPGERWVQTPAETEAVTAGLLPPMTESFHRLLDDFVAGFQRGER